jgi:hypothetical protein
VKISSAGFDDESVDPELPGFHVEKPAAFQPPQTPSESKYLLIGEHIDNQ